MGFNIYIFIIAVIIVGLYFYMNKNKEKKYEEKRYDLIVIFKEEKYTDIRNNESLNQLANRDLHSFPTRRSSDLFLFTNKRRVRRNNYSRTSFRKR